MFVLRTFDNQTPTPTRCLYGVRQVLGHTRRHSASTKYLYIFVFCLNVSQYQTDVFDVSAQLFSSSLQNWSVPATTSPTQMSARQEWSVLRSLTGVSLSLSICPLSLPSLLVSPDHHLPSSLGPCRLTQCWGWSSHHTTQLHLTLTVFCPAPLLAKYASPGRDYCLAGDHSQG